MPIFELPFLSVGEEYGGNQDNFKRPMMKGGGCSTVCACHAAANVAALRGADSRLYPFGGMELTQEEFYGFAKKMFKYVYPTAKGMPETAMFERAFQNYAASVGDGVGFESLQGSAPYAEAERFITDKLERGIWVQYLLLRHKDEAFSDIEWHWFTVTGFERGEDGFYIIYSSFGKRERANLAALWDTGRGELGGMIAVMP